MSDANNTLFKGFVRQNPSDFNHGQPLDTASVRLLQNNLDNLYYGHFQVRVSDGQRAPLVFKVVDLASTSDRRVKVITYGPFPLTILKSGKPAPIYIECCASVIDDPVKVIAVLRNQRTIPSYPAPGTWGPHVGSVQFTSLTPSWKQLDGANKTIRMDQRLLQYQGLNTRLALGQGDISVESAMVCIDVYLELPALTKTEGINLYGFYATELGYEIED